MVLNRGEQWVTLRMTPHLGPQCSLRKHDVKSEAEEIEHLRAIISIFIGCVTVVCFLSLPACCPLRPNRCRGTALRAEEAIMYVFFFCILGNLSLSHPAFIELFCYIHKYIYYYIDIIVIYRSIREGKGYHIQTSACPLTSAWSTSAPECGHHSQRSAEGRRRQDKNKDADFNQM